MITGMWQFFTSSDNYWVAILLLTLDWSIRIVLGVRVVMRRGTVGYTLAWLSVILFVPVLGAFLYLLLGERRLGARRARRIVELRGPYQTWLKSLSDEFPLDEESLGPAAAKLTRQVRGGIGIPALPGNTLHLMDNASAFFESLIADIDAAKSSVHLQFYIWEPGGRVEHVVEALLRAHGRGVACRVLVDNVGGMEFLMDESCSRLRIAGVQVIAMLHVGVIRAVLARLDLRNHRKIAVIDGQIAYTGSQNMIDPKLRPDPDTGEWVDAMVRMTGPAVEALQVTLLADWEFETFEGIEKNAEKLDVRRNAIGGDALVQVVPSGPGLSLVAIHELILTAIYSAERELIMTTPYFIPDDAMIKALLSAAARNVSVTLVVPRRPDGRLVKLASQAYFEELLEGGVKIARFDGGVLHTKAITVDGQLAMFGSVNLDMRSFYLNFEISLLVYNRAFTAEVQALQRRYLQSSVEINLQAWQARPLLLRFVQQVAQLLSPLL